MIQAVDSSAARNAIIRQRASLIDYHDRAEPNLAFDLDDWGLVLAVCPAKVQPGRRQIQVQCRSEVMVSS
jgi:hypothetical protein